MSDQISDATQLSRELASGAEVVLILYTNYRGEQAWRRVLPHQIKFATTEWHPDAQWLLEATDVDRGVERSFAVCDIDRWVRPATSVSIDH